MISSYLRVAITKRWQATDVMFRRDVTAICVWLAQTALAYSSLRLCRSSLVFLCVLGIFIFSPAAEGGAAAALWVAPS